MNKKVLAGIGLGAILLIIVSLVYLVKGSKKVVPPASQEVATVPPTATEQVPAITGKLGGPSPEKPAAPSAGEPPGVPETTPSPTKPVLPTLPEPSVAEKPAPAVPEPTVPEKAEGSKTKTKAKAKAGGPAPKQKEYGILVAKFRNYRSAKNLAAKLKRQGKKSYVSRDPAKKSVYEVWVAPLATPAQAKALAKSIKVKYKLCPTVQQVKRLPPK